MSTLNASLGWHPSWKEESIFGVPIPYRNNNNTAIAHTFPNGSYPTFSGIAYQIAQLSPYNVICHCWNSPDMNVSHGIATNSAQTAIYQALNYFIRGDSADAFTDFNLTTKEWNGSGFLDTNAKSNHFFRGEDLALYLYAAKVLPAEWSNVTTLAIIEAKLWSLQNFDGGIALSYNTTTINHSVVETSEAALLPYSPTLISYVQRVAQSGVYNLMTPPPPNFDIYPPFVTISTTSTVVTTSTTTVTATQVTQSTQILSTTSIFDSTSTVDATQTINSTRTFSTTQTSDITQTSDTTQIYSSTTTFSSTYQTTITQTVTTTQTSSVVSSSGTTT